MLKINLVFWTVTMVALLSCTSFASGNEDQGKGSSPHDKLFVAAKQKHKANEGGHGGHYVDVNSRTALRDLVDKTVCHWLSANEFIEQHLPKYQDFYDGLERAHWYFADAFRREVNKTQFCETFGRLKRIPVEDQDGLTVYEENSKQLAIRLNDQVFMDMTAFNRLLNDTHKTFTFVHEIMHSFIPFDAPRRNDSLRSTIAMLNSDVSTSTLANIIKNNYIDMPESTSAIDAVKTEILTVVNPEAPLAQRLALAKKVVFFKNYLWSEDRHLLEGGLEQMRDIAHQRIRAAIELGQLDEVKKIYSDTQFNPNEGIEFSVGFITESHWQYSQSGLENRHGWLAGDGKYVPGLVYASRYAQPGIVRWFLSLPNTDVNFDKPLAEAILPLSKYGEPIPKGIENDADLKTRYMDVIAALSSNSRLDIRYQTKTALPGGQLLDFLDKETSAQIETTISRHSKR